MYTYTQMLICIHIHICIYIYIYIYAVHNSPFFGGPLRYPSPSLPTARGTTTTAAVGRCFVALHGIAGGAEFEYHGHGTGPKRRGAWHWGKGETMDGWMGRKLVDLVDFNSFEVVCWGTSIFLQLFSIRQRVNILDVLNLSKCVVFWQEEGGPSGTHSKWVIFQNYGYVSLREAMWHNLMGCFKFGMWGSWVFVRRRKWTGRASWRTAPGWRFTVFSNFLTTWLWWFQSFHASETETHSFQEGLRMPDKPNTKRL